MEDVGSLWMKVRRWRGGLRELESRTYHEASAAYDCSGEGRLGHFVVAKVVFSMKYRNEF